MQVEGPNGEIVELPDDPLAVFEWMMARKAEMPPQEYAAWIDRLHDRDIRMPDPKWVVPFSLG
jgi:hypothetical protein